MKLETLKKAKELEKEIKDTETILTDARNQKTEWITFTFGNGSNSSTVCRDEKDIDFIRDYLIKTHKLKLDSLKEELEKL